MEVRGQTQIGPYLHLVVDIRSAHARLADPGASRDSPASTSQLTEIKGMGYPTGVLMGFPALKSSLHHTRMARACITEPSFQPFTLRFVSLCSVALEKTFYRTAVFVTFLITVTKSLMEMPKGRKDLALAYSFRRFILLSFGPMSIQVQKRM